MTRALSLPASEAEASDPPANPAALPQARHDSAALRVGRAFPRAAARGLGGAFVGAALAMGLGATGWFPSRPASHVLFLDGLTLGLCFGLAALVEAVGWGPAARPSRARIALSALAVWLVATGVSWATQFEVAYFDGRVVEGLTHAELQVALQSSLDAVRDDALTHLVVNALLGLPFAVLSLGDGARLGRAELAGMAFFATTIPALPVCFGNPMFEGGANPDSGLQFLLVAGLALALPAVGKLSDLREGRAPVLLPDRKLAWLATLALALITPGIWAATRVQGDARLNYLLLAELRVETAREALERGDYASAIAVCRQGEEQGTALFARPELRACWIEAAWVLEVEGPDALSEQEHAWSASLQEDRGWRFRRARSRLARGDYAGALAEVDALRRLPDDREPPSSSELWLLCAEAHARLGDRSAALHALEMLKINRHLVPPEARARVHTILAESARRAPPRYRAQPSGW